MRSFKNVTRMRTNYLCRSDLLRSLNVATDINESKVAGLIILMMYTRAVPYEYAEPRPPFWRFPSKGPDDLAVS
jgi:hypothetical protein